MKKLRGYARAPGTCGELVEGTMNGKDFLITCPVDIWSEIEVETVENARKERIFPKTMQAIKMALREWGYSGYNFKFTRRSPLPIGKGMGSSTADISAAIKAVARALKIEVSSDEIADLALKVEPSDGLMYHGIYLFDHKKGLLRRNIGSPLPLDIVVLDPGGEIDTVKFNSMSRLQELNLKKEPLVKKGAQLVIEGFEEGDPEKVGRGATISAVANQEILPKPELNTVLKWAKEIKAVGVNIAHSGTVMGILIPAELIDTEEIVRYLKSKRKTWNIFRTKLVGGGVR